MPALTPAQHVHRLTSQYTESLKNAQELFLNKDFKSVTNEDWDAGFLLEFMRIVHIKYSNLLKLMVEDSKAQTILSRLYLALDTLSENPTLEAYIDTAQSVMASPLFTEYRDACRKQEIGGMGAIILISGISIGGLLVLMEYSDVLGVPGTIGIMFVGIVLFMASVKYFSVMIAKEGNKVCHLDAIETDEPPSSIIISSSLRDDSAPQTNKTIRTEDKLSNGSPINKESYSSFKFFSGSFLKDEIENRFNSLSPTPS